MLHYTVWIGRVQRNGDYNQLQTILRGSGREHVLPALIVPGRDGINRSGITA